MTPSSGLAGYKRLLLSVVVGPVALASVTVSEASAEIRPAGTTVWVTERTAGSVVALDAASGELLASARTGVGPIGVTQPRGTGKVYTTDEGSNQVSVFDRATLSRRAAIAMGPKPHHLMASTDGKRVYVAEFGANQIGVVDTTNDRRVATFIASPRSDARTHAVFITRDGHHVYAANSRADRALPGDIAKLDAKTGLSLWEHNLVVGVDPSEVLVTPDGKTAYVSVRGENKVKEIDLSAVAPVIVRETAVGIQPDTLHLTNDGQTLVVTLRGSPAQISFVDTSSLAVRTTTISGHTTTGHHWFSANGTLTYVAVEGPGGLAVIDNKTGRLLADHPYHDRPGSARPHGVFVEPDCDALATGRDESLASQRVRSRSAP